MSHSRTGAVIMLEGVTLPMVTVDGKGPDKNGERPLLLRWKGHAVHWEHPADLRDAMDDGTDWVMILEPNVWAEPRVMSEVCKRRLKQVPSDLEWKRDPSYHWRDRKLGGANG